MALEKVFIMDLEMVETMDVWMNLQLAPMKK